MYHIHKMDVKLWRYSKFAEKKSYNYIVLILQNLDDYAKQCKK